MPAMTLREKLALQRQKALANTKQTTDAIANKEVAPVNNTHVTLDNIATQVSEQLSKADAHALSQEQKGVYNFEPITSIEGLDVNTFTHNMKELDKALVEKTPDIKHLSLAIRQNLQQYKELTHLLTDEQLHILVSGMLETAGVETAPKGKGKGSSNNNKVLTPDEVAQLDMSDLLGSFAKK